MKSGEQGTKREEERGASATLERSPYDVLEVKPGASREEIEAAYRRALRLIDGNSLGGYLMLEPDARENARREVEGAFETLMQRVAREESARSSASPPEREMPPAAPVTESERGGRRARRRHKRKARRAREERRSELRPTDGDATLPVRPAFDSAADSAADSAVDSAFDSAFDSAVHEKPVAPASEAQGEPLREGRSCEQPSTPPRKKPALRFLAPVIETAPAPARETPARTSPPSTSETLRPFSSTPRPAARASTMPPTTHASTRPMTQPPTTQPPTTQPPTSRRPWLYSDAGAEGVAEPRVIARSDEDDEHLTLPPESEINGGTIRRLREARGITIEELAEQTHIRKSYLRAIEDHNLEELPADVYLRGFVTQIARVLRVDKKRLAEGYMSFVARFRR